MDNKIVTARFATDDNYVNVYDVYQWSYGQVLRIEGLKLPNMVEIHFSLQETSGEAKTRIGVTKDSVTDVVIPDSFLENNGIGDDYKIFVWVYVADKDSGRTEYKITIHIKARAKPEITHGGQDGEMFQEAVEAVRDAAKRAAESEKQAERWAVGRADIPGSETDNSKFYSEESKKNAQQTTKDKEAVEELVKKTENIGQLAEDVKANAQKASESAKNAETSATNASVSEKNAKTSESNASTSETNAKASETNAKASEQAVEKSKQTVDKTVADFGQAVTNASAALKSEKDAHVKAITTAGTTETKKVTDEGAKQVQAVQSIGTQETEKVTAEGTKQVTLVKTEGEKHLAEVQTAAQEIITDRKQIQKNTTEISALKEGIPSKLSELQEDNTHRTVTDAEKENWNAKSDFSGNYNDLENKPTIPQTLPNPHALVFRGAVSGVYDGSEKKTIEIPAGGGGTNIDDADLKLLIDYTLPSELAEAVSIDFTEREYPGISNLKLIYIVVFMPDKNSNPKWWAVRTAQDNGPYMEVINFDVSLQKMAGLAKVINKRWWQGANAQSNANIVSVSCPKLLYKVDKIEGVIDDNIFEKNQEFKPFNKINLYSYGKFLMEGTRILIYGAK